MQIFFSQLLAIMYMFIVMQNKRSSSALGSGYYSGSSASSGYYSGHGSASSGYYSGSSAYYSGSSGTIGHSEPKSILGDYNNAIIILQSIPVVDMLNLKSFISSS